MVIAGEWENDVSRFFDRLLIEFISGEGDFWGFNNDCFDSLFDPIPKVA